MKSDTHAQSFLKKCMLTFVLLLQAVHASWWYLGLSSSTYHGIINSMEMNTRSKCSRIDVLEYNQRQLCSKSGNVLDIIAEGAGLGIDECQEQFFDRRWNCSTFNETNVFGQVINLKSREQAYIYAISAAGVMYAMTKACAKGDLHMCGCDPHIDKINTYDQFIWGGCSHNVKFAKKFTKEFVDYKEYSRGTDGLMNLWNNRAGRRTISGSMKLICKCHGVSGSCSAKICWRIMSKFSSVGSHLKKRYDGASLVKSNRRKTKLTTVQKAQKKPDKNDLVYINGSPDYCSYNKHYGSLGTKGRTCNKDSYGLDGCQLMCCGRGYYSVIINIEEECKCKFFWCCRVQCETCTKVVEKTTCN